MIVRIKAVRAVKPPVVEIELTDGEVRTIDLSPFLDGEIFAPVRADARYFARVRVHPELRTLVWPNGADIDPDVLIGARQTVG